MSVIRGVFFISYSFLKRLWFVTLRTWFNAGRAVSWRFRGTSQEVLESQQPLNYKRSAQVLNIAHRHHLDFLLVYSMGDFMCTHERFVSPEYVLQDHINLFFLDGDMAVFSEADPGVQTWKLEHGAFVREANEHLSKKLIVMPLKSLIRLGKEIGPPKESLTFLFNTARCGSTLLTQMLEHTGQCVSISEPDGLNYLAKVYRDHGETPEVKELTQSFINLTCKHVKEPAANKAFFVKLTAPAVVALPFFHELFPDANFIFMYRDIVKVAKSIYRITQVMPLLLLTLYGGRISEKAVELVMNEIGISGKDYKMRYKDLLCLGTSTWCISTRQYLDLRKENQNIPCIRYEDIIADPVYTMKAILRHCHLPEELAESATEALKKDSQGKSVLSQGNNFKAPDLTPQREKNMNEVLAKFNLPPMTDTCILEGIIGWKGAED